MAVLVNPGIDIVEFMRLKNDELRIVTRVLERALKIKDKRRKAEIEGLGTTIANQVAKIFG